MWIVWIMWIKKDLLFIIPIISTVEVESVGGFYPQKDEKYPQYLSRS